MVTLVLSIIAASLSFYLTNNYAYFSVLVLGIYYVIRKNSKAQTFTALNLILISAIALFGKFRPYSQDGLNFIVYGSFLSIVYDILKKWYSVIPMFLFTGIGISLIGSVKFGKAGLLFGLILIPVVIREYTIQKRANSEIVGGEKE